MTINDLCDKWTRHEKRVEVMSLRVSERTLNDLQAIAAKHNLASASIAHDFLLLGLSLYEKDQSI